PIPRRTLRRFPAGHGPPDGEVVLSPLQLSELVHDGELRRVHLHRLPLRGPGALQHWAAAGAGERLWDRRQVSEREGWLSLDRCARDLEQRGLPERAEPAELSRGRA